MSGLRNSLKNCSFSIWHSPVAQLVERVAVKFSSFPSEDGLKQRENCWKPKSRYNIGEGNQQPSPRRFASQSEAAGEGSETMHLLPHLPM